MTTISEPINKQETVSTGAQSPKFQEIKFAKFESRIDSLESQLLTLETGIQQYLTVDTLVTLLTGSSPFEIKVRKKREYTDEERKAIRDRLEAEKKAKQKSLESQNRSNFNSPKL